MSRGFGPPPHGRRLARPADRPCVEFGRPGLRRLRPADAQGKDRPNRLRDRSVRNGDGHRESGLDTPRIPAARGVYYRRLSLRWRSSTHVPKASSLNFGPCRDDSESRQTSLPRFFVRILPNQPRVRSFGRRRVTDRRTRMRNAALLAIIGLGLALGTANAQVPGTNLGTPQTQPQPGGGVASGPGAPTPANPGATGSSTVAPRGAPPAGGGAAVPGGDPSSSTVAPSGAIRPGSPGTDGTGSSGGENR
jgi:hypothetical protein